MTIKNIVSCLLVRRTVQYSDSGDYHDLETLFSLRVLHTGMLCPHLSFENASNSGSFGTRIQSAHDPGDVDEPM